MKRKIEYRELGEGYLQNRSVEKKVRNHVKLLEKLGYEVSLQKTA